MSLIKGYWAAEGDALFLWLTVPYQRVPVQYGHVCYVNTLNRSTLTSTECLAFNMTWYHGNWILSYNYRSTPHQGYMERMSRTTICWGWKNALATRRTSFRNWGGTSAIGKGLYITVLVSVLIKILLVSYSNCIWCDPIYARVDLTWTGFTGGSNHRYRSSRYIIFNPWPSPA